MKVTPRCQEIMKLLSVARWLTTSQIHRRFFAGATPDATRKRLRKMQEGKFIRAVQPNRMVQTFSTLAGEGKRFLEMNGAEEIVLERQLPRQVEHLVGINDIRIAAELHLPLSYFFACWELGKLEWEHQVIPDAVFSFEGRTFAVEYDRGGEGLQYFVRTKMSVYRQGLHGFPLSALVIVTDRMARMKALARVVNAGQPRVLFSTIELVRKYGMLAPIFSRTPRDEALKLSSQDLLSASLVDKRVFESQTSTIETVVRRGNPPLQANDICQ